MLLSDFWAQQRFRYIVTYSFQRGPALGALRKQLTQELETAHYMQRPTIQQQLNSLNPHSLTLTKRLGVIDPTAIAVARLAVGSGDAQHLSVVAQRAGRQECYAMCLPVYRDALAFYNDAAELVSVLNICFQCSFMQTEQQEHVEADMATYARLETFLMQLGHPIEADN